MSETVSKIALGTANFGQAYGIKNTRGRLRDSELFNIMNTANYFNINTFDTAQAYGDSEVRLKSFLQPNSQVITKIGVSNREPFGPGDVVGAVYKSLEYLNRDTLTGVLFHRPEVFAGPYGYKFVSGLLKLKEMGIVKKIGVSIYGPEILEDVLKVFQPDIVQVPFNIFDQRIVQTGWVERLKSNGTEIHTRSTFLQGLLLMKDDQVPNKFRQKWKDLFNLWFQYQKRLELKADTLALSYCLQQPWIDQIVLGVDNNNQLKRLIEIESSRVNKIIDGFLVSDEMLINPSLWKNI